MACTKQPATNDPDCTFGSATGAAQPATTDPDCTFGSATGAAQPATTDPDCTFGSAWDFFENDSDCTLGSATGAAQAATTDPDCTFGSACARCGGTGLSRGLLKVDGTRATCCFCRGYGSKKQKNYGSKKQKKAKRGGGGFIDGLLAGRVMGREWIHGSVAFLPDGMQDKRTIPGISRTGRRVRPRRG